MSLARPARLRQCSAGLRRDALRRVEARSGSHHRRDAWL